MDTCDIDSLSECVKSIAIDYLFTSEVMIYWGTDFNPNTANFETMLIDTLIENVDGLELIANDRDMTIFMLNDCEISMNYDVDFHCYESCFSFALTCRPDDTPISNDNQLGGWWFEEDE